MPVPAWSNLNFSPLLLPRPFYLYKTSDVAFGIFHVDKLPVIHLQRPYGEYVFLERMAHNCTRAHPHCLLHAFQCHSFGLGLRVGARVRLCNFHVVRRQQEVVALGACAWSSIDILSFSTAADPLPGIAPALYQHQRWVKRAESKKNIAPQIICATTPADSATPLPASSASPYRFIHMFVGLAKACLLLRTTGSMRLHVCCSKN